MLSVCHSAGVFDQLDSPMPVRDRIMTHLVKQVLGTEGPSTEQGVVSVDHAVCGGFLLMSEAAGG